MLNCKTVLNYGDFDCACDFDKICSPYFDVFTHANG